MEDRYLFRAKRIDNGEWVEGNIMTYNDRCFIVQKFGISCIEEHKNLMGDNMISLYAFEADPSTICQCTGLKDKHGNLIWENDILHNGNYFIVKWNAPCARFDIVLNNSHNIPIGKWEPMICDWKTNDFKEYRKSVDYEAIGNIFDNPELLESEG